MSTLNDFGSIDTCHILDIHEKYGAPAYIYDWAAIAERCSRVLSMPNAFGLTVRYAMKANSNRTLLREITGLGLHIDASSLAEARRAVMAGVGCEKIILSSQEIPCGSDRDTLEDMMKHGLLYNVCSLRQLRLIGEFAADSGIALSMRVHPGVGSGESASRNTGDHYSCFGVHLRDIGAALEYANGLGLKFTQVHAHIGSGGDPDLWRENIERELSILERHFPDAVSISFGGGLKEARMPGEDSADTEALGRYAAERLSAFYARTGRKLNMEIEPGTYIVANAGYALTRVMDKKSTGDGGFNFIVVNGGMELNARPAMYGSRHPFYVISRDGKLLSSEFGPIGGNFSAIVAGRCCESGDTQNVGADGRSVPRAMAEPEVGDFVVIGGAGAYCSSMAPFNYNSYSQAPEVLVRQDGSIQLIRRRQELEQIVANEAIDD
ncbi:MAG: diaminopimelate decarboxylase [Oscillospiraceae bacterium]|jgi:diaminopimelate decarboxylase|nr:diaminopimelate decarboxylase [Oscillospiraceae bacterium]